MPVPSLSNRRYYLSFKVEAPAEPGLAAPALAAAAHFGPGIKVALFNMRFECVCRLGNGHRPFHVVPASVPAYLSVGKAHTIHYIFFLVKLEMGDRFERCCCGNARDGILFVLRSNVPAI